MSISSNLKKIKIKNDVPDTNVDILNDTLLHCDGGRHLEVLINIGRPGGYLFLFAKS